MHWFKIVFVTFSVIFIIAIQHSIGQVSSLYLVDPATISRVSSQEVAVFHDGFYYLGGKSSDYRMDQPLVTKVDLYGKVVWSTSQHEKDPIAENQIGQLLFVNDELFAANGTVLWKVDIETGKIIWRAPLLYGKIIPYNDTAFISLSSNKLQLVSVANGAVLDEGINLAAATDWSSAVTDPQGNIYVTEGRKCFKFDRNLDVVWTKSVSNNAALFNSAYDHTYNRVIVFGEEWSHIISIDPVSSDTIWDRKLPFLFSTVSDHVVEDGFLYVSWFLDEDITSIGQLVQKIDLQSGGVIWEREIFQSDFRMWQAKLDMSEDFLYCATNLRSDDPDQVNISQSKIDKATGELIYHKVVLNPTGLAQSEVREIKVVEDKIFIGLAYKNINLPAEENSFHSQYRSSLLIIDEESGDFFQHHIYHGTMQYESRATHLALLSPDSLIVGSLLGEGTEIGCFDLQFNKHWSVYIPGREIKGISITSDRVGIITERVLNVDPYDSLYHDEYNYFYLTDHHGNILYEKWLGEKSHYTGATQNTIFVVNFQGQDLWQIVEDSLIELPLNPASIDLDEVVLPWQEDKSVMFERYNIPNVQSTFIELYEAKTQTITIIDTLFFHSIIQASATFHNSLYISTSRLENQNIDKYLIKYDLNSEGIIWQQIDHNYSKILASNEIIYGLNGTSSKTYVNAIDPLSGDILWSDTIDLSYYKLQFTIDTFTHHLYLHDYPATINGVEYIRFMSLSPAGELAEILGNPGHETYFNHMHDILPVRYLDHHYFITCGAYQHPELRKTAYINIYDADQITNPIYLKVFFDQDGDGIKDPNETYRKIGKIFINSSELIYNNYAIARSSVIPDTVLFVAPPYWEVTTDSIVYLTAASADTIQFGVNIDSAFAVLDVSLAAIDLWRCNNDFNIKLTMVNDGSEFVSGKVKVFVPNVFDVISSSIPYNEIINDTIIYDFSAMEFENFVTTIHLEDIGLTNIDDIYSIQYFVEYSGDFSGVQDKKEGILADRVRCSLDPNDKLVNPMREGENFTDKDEPLIYTIRFQNLGTDTAFRVVILDTLSSYLDHTTLKFLSSSHECQMRIENNILKIEFAGIALPFASIDEEESQGYIQFTIRPKPGLAEYTEVNNQAAIYFDFNTPVITNITSSILVEEVISNTNDFSPEPQLILYPNPASKFIHIHLPEETLLELRPFIISDLYGRRRFYEKTDFTQPIFLKDFVPGIYFVKLPGYQTGKLIIE